MAKKLEIIRRSAGIFRHIDIDGQVLLNAFIEIIGNELAIHSLNHTETMDINEVYVNDDLNDSISVCYNTAEELVFRLKALGYVDWNMSSGVAGSSDGLTNAQLRNTPVGVFSDVSRDAGVVNDKTQRMTLASDDPAVNSLNSIETKTPALVNSRVPVTTEERPSAIASAITPSDSVNLSSTTRGVYVGGAGNIVAIIGGTTITFTAVPVGMILPIQATRINSTNTTAINLVALF